LGGYALNKKFVFFIGLTLLAFTVLSACSSTNQENDPKEEVSESAKQTIQIGTNNWVENIAVSNMWKVLLAERGYNTELVAVEKAVLYEGLSSGDLDLGIEIWLPETDKFYYEQYEDQLELGEVWYEGTELALVVPTYMENINSIEDLNEHAEKFDSTIVGIEPGASLMMLTEDVMEAYHLKFELQPSSEAAMLTELQTKMRNEEPVVVTLWKPHSSFAEMDLKVLEDPKNIYGDSENIYYVGRESFSQDYPEVAKWLNAFELDDEQLGTLMAAVENAESEVAGAKQWIAQNEALVNSWFD